MPARIALAAGVIALVSASPTAARATAWQAPAVTTSFTMTGAVEGVAALSPGNAWAVGYSGIPFTDAKTLILHWNGRKWAQVTNPRPVYGALNAVTAVTPDNIWAVGDTSTPAGANERALVMHWNGRAWNRQAGAPAAVGALAAVAGTAKSVWAVGGILRNPSAGTALVLHRTGGRWFLVPTEAPASSVLGAVAVTGSKTAWAGGAAFAGTSKVNGLLLRWNGTVWKSAANPLQGPDNEFVAMTASPAGAVWIAGVTVNTVNGPCTSMLWNGKTWRKVPVPNANSSTLQGVTFIPGGTAWAVGGGPFGAVTLRWTGSAWTQVANRAASGVLFTVAATSAHDAWAAGILNQQPGSLKTKTLLLHWNGKAWG